MKKSKYEEKSCGTELEQEVRKEKEKKDSKHWKKEVSGEA